MNFAFLPLKYFLPGDEAMNATPSRCPSGSGPSAGSPSRRTGAKPKSASSARKPSSSASSSQGRSAAPSVRIVVQPARAGHLEPEAAAHRCRSCPSQPCSPSSQRYSSRPSSQQTRLVPGRTSWA